MITHPLNPQSVEPETRRNWFFKRSGIVELCSPSVMVGMGFLSPNPTLTDRCSTLLPVVQSANSIKSVFHLRIQETLKSCHYYGHRDTIGLAERFVLEMENRDTIWEIVTRFNNFLTKFTWKGLVTMVVQRQSWRDWSKSWHDFGLLWLVFKWILQFFERDLKLEA